MLKKSIALQAEINPISAQIRFFVIRLALNSLISKVKENTEIFQIHPIPLLLRGNLMKSLKNLPPFLKGDRGGFRRAQRLLHGIELRKFLPFVGSSLLRRERSDLH
jgi:hypothetical protein